MSREVSNMEDLLDSRDVIARIEELEAEIETASQCGACNGTGDAPTDPAGDPVSDRCADCNGTGKDPDPDLAELQEELEPLKKLADEASGYAADWSHGETLIRDSYFETYAQELAEDIYGKELQGLKWPFSCIDWEQAARELQMDYTSVEYGDVTYWIR